MEPVAEEPVAEGTARSGRRSGAAPAAREAARAAAALRLVSAMAMACGCSNATGRLMPDAGARDAAPADAASGRADGGGVGTDGDARDGDGPGRPLDGGGSMDAAADAHASADGGTGDGATAGHDGGTDGGGSHPADDGGSGRSEHHVHIQVDNFCNMTVTPEEITVPEGETAYFAWHNHSVDYEVDVWMSYGGGYLDLERGATWEEPIGHCGGPSAHTEYADISTACSEHRFLIHCL